MEVTGTTEEPLFSAVSSSARRMLQILRTLGFAKKAHVQITESGIRISVSEAKVMQGLAFLDRSIFSSYKYNLPQSNDGDNAGSDSPLPFQVSMPALIETLQIFGINDVRDRWAPREPNNGGLSASRMRVGQTTAFDNRVLSTAGLCRISYASQGAPLSIILEETGVVTTCELVTFEADLLSDIPLQKEGLVHKIIMRANWLFDAVTELAATMPTRLIMIASPSAPFFSLSASGAHGSTKVEFNKDPQLLETFQVHRRAVNAYKYELIMDASRAMSMASKVSIRGDEQGVLSLQFMIEIEDSEPTFVEFRFVPYISEEGEDDEDEDVRFDALQ